MKSSASKSSVPESKFPPKPGGKNGWAVPNCAEIEFETAVLN